MSEGGTAARLYFSERLEKPDIQLNKFYLGSTAKVRTRTIRNTPRLYKQILLANGRLVRNPLGLISIYIHILATTVSFVLYFR